MFVEHLMGRSAPRTGDRLTLTIPPDGCHRVLKKVEKDEGALEESSGYQLPRPGWRSRLRTLTSGAAFSRPGEFIVRGARGTFRETILPRPPGLITSTTSAIF